MKTKNLKKLSYLLVALILFMGCQTEPVLEETETVLEQQNLSFDMLPEHIKAKVTRSEEYFLGIGNPFIAGKTTVKGSASNASRYQGASFGAIDPTHATHTLDRVGNDSYALAMERGGDPRALDNMVIVDRGNGETTTFIVRHLPTDDWFLKNPNPVDFGLEFSGTLQVFDEHNGLIAESLLENGEVIGAEVPNSKASIAKANSAGIAGLASSSGPCFLVGLEKVGLVQGNTFYIYEYNLTFKCTDLGGNGAGGDHVSNPFGDSTYGQGGGTGGSGGSSGSGGGNGSLDYDPVLIECPEGYINAPVPGGCVEISRFEYPDCSMFSYSYVGGSNGNKLWQAAAVRGVYDVVWHISGKCPNIGVASFAQPIYFQLPGYHPSGRAANLSSVALNEAFKRFQRWYDRSAALRCQGGHDPRIASSFLSLIKEEFEDIGGKADLVPPQGVWSGTVREYEESINPFGGLDCD